MAVEQLVIAGDQGTCGGVNAADIKTRVLLDTVAERRPVVTLWDVIHNTPYMEQMRALGLSSLNDYVPKDERSKDIVQNVLHYLPRNSVAILPAHGSFPQLIAAVEETGSHAENMQCKLVDPGQKAAERAVAQGMWVAYQGIENHPETNSVIRRLPDDSYTLIDTRKVKALQPVDRSKYLQDLGIPTDKDLVVLNQTTLSPGDMREITSWLRANYPRLVSTGRVLQNICYAMENRWNSVTEMIENGMIDALLVVGSIHSHNSQELRIAGEDHNLPSYSVDKPEEIESSWFESPITRVGLTSGASVFPQFLEPVKQWFRKANPNLKMIDLPRSERDLSFVSERELVELKERVENFIGRK